MMTSTLLTDPVTIAVQLRRRLRSLAEGQTEAFDMVFYHIGSNHRLAPVAHSAWKRLAFLTTLLADLAWVNGDRDAHDRTPPPAASEVAEVKRGYRPHADIRRQYIMSAEQRSAAIGYLDALLVLTADCAKLDEHAPSHTLAREALRFTDEITQLRDAVIAS